MLTTLGTIFLLINFPYQNNVIKFEVSVCDFHLVHVGDCANKLAHYCCCIFLGFYLVSLESFQEGAALAELGDHIKKIFIIKYIVQFYNVYVVHFFKDVYL